MTHTPQEQPKREAVREVQRTEAEITRTSPEILTSPHDILGKEYDFNGVSFTVLGMDKEFYGTDDEQDGLSIDEVAIMTVDSQRIPVIPYKGGRAHITKIQIGNEIITGSEAILKRMIIVECAPQGWMTNKGLARELKVGASTISNCANQYRLSNTEWFHLYKDRRGRLSEHYTPNLCDLIRNELSKREQAPPGWMTNGGLACKLNVSQKTITNCANQYRLSNTEWFHLYKDGGGQLYEHYAPELCDLIRNELSKREQAPVRWMTKVGLTKELKVGAKTISNLASQYRQPHPEWFHLYKNAGGGLSEHYSPNLCDLIRNELSKQEQAPPEWITNTGFACELRAGTDTITNRANQYRQLHPEWFHLYKDRRGGLSEHYSPNLCDLIRNELSKQEQAPPEWITNTGLAHELNVTQKTIASRARQYRQSNTEWFKMYRDSGGHSREHYSPNLCDLIRNELSKREQAPTEWMTNRGLAHELNVTQKTIASRARQYRQSNTEWFHDYKSASGKIHEHYSPELCNLIREAVKDKRS